MTQYQDLEKNGLYTLTYFENLYNEIEADILSGVAVSDSIKEHGPGFLHTLCLYHQHALNGVSQQRAADKITGNQAVKLIEGPLQNMAHSFLLLHGIDPSRATVEAFTAFIGTRFMEITEELKHVRPFEL